MRNYFNALVDFLNQEVDDSEVYLASFYSEESDFCRFNQGKVRQAGTTKQAGLSVNLICKKRQALGELTVSFEVDADRNAILSLLKTLREQLEVLPVDPYILYSEDVNSTKVLVENELPPASKMVSDIIAAAEGLDLVGILAAGGVFSGFANSLGQRNWYQNFNFNFDYSIYLKTDKAVKSGYAGVKYSQKELENSIQSAARQLSYLKRDPIKIEPGKYKVFLAPAAVSELVGMLNWGGFGLKALKTKGSCLQKMYDGDLVLSDKVSLSEDTANGLAPGFTGAGYIKPDRIPMIARGKFTSPLVSPRSSKEFGEEQNGGEDFVSLDMAAGDLAQADALKELGTGVYINNLWYVNYSDRASCRMTGMTRFASFWVENGEIVAPLNVMRFDGSLFDILGKNLLAVTKERSMIPSASTYGSRSAASEKLPGILVKDFHFTL